MPQRASPQDKFDLLVQLSNEINNSIEFNEQNKLSKGDTKKKLDGIGADDLFPVFLYIFIKANIPCLYSEYQFLNHFNDERIQSGVESYRFATFSLALTFSDMMVYNESFFYNL